MVIAQSQFIKLHGHMKLSDMETDRLMCINLPALVFVNIEMCIAPVINPCRNYTNSNFEG